MKRVDDRSSGKRKQITGDGAQWRSLEPLEDRVLLSAAPTELPAVQKVVEAVPSLELPAVQKVREAALKANLGVGVGDGENGDGENGGVGSPIAIKVQEILLPVVHKIHEIARTLHDGEGDDPVQHKVEEFLLPAVHKVREIAMSLHDGGLK